MGFTNALHCYQAGGALLPHLLTLTALKRIKHGGLISAALSMDLRPPGVTRHRISLKPGLSSYDLTSQAAAQLSGETFIRLLHLIGQGFG